MNETFNEDICVKNIYRALGLEEKDYLPHYVTINECLSRLDNSELEKEEIDRRKSNVKQKLQIKWVNGIEYRKHPIHVLELKIERAGKPYRSFT